MCELSKEYLTLFNTVTDTAEALERLRQRLLLAQQRAEALYLEQTEENGKAD